MLPRVTHMGLCNQAQTWRTIHPTLKDLCIVTNGTARTSQIRQRTPCQRIHSTLEEPLCCTILLHQEEGWKVTPRTRLPTPERMDDTQSLPTTPHPTVDQPRQDEEALHQIRRPLGL